MSGPAPGARALFARYEAPQAVVGWRGEAHGRGYRAATNDEPRQAEITACTPNCTTSTLPRRITIKASPEFATNKPGPRHRLLDRRPLPIERPQRKGVTNLHSECYANLAHISTTN